MYWHPWQTGSVFVCVCVCVCACACVCVCVCARARYMCVCLCMGHGGSFTPCTQMWSPITSVGRAPISLCLSVCVCVCVCEREGERERTRMPALCIYLHPRSRRGLWGIPPTHYSWFENLHTFFSKCMHFILFLRFHKCGNSFENSRIYICLKGAHIIEYKRVYLKCFSQCSVLLKAQAREGKSKTAEKHQ